MHNHDTGTSEDKLYAYIGRNTNTNEIAHRTPELVKRLTLEAAVCAGEGAPRVKSCDMAANWSVGACFQDDTDGYGAGLGNRKG